MSFVFYSRDKTYDKVCAVCGKAFVAKAVNAKYCSPECRRVADAENSRMCRRYNKENGLCTRCGKPSETRLCPDCVIRTKAADKAFRARCIRAGICIICGKPAEPGLKRCRACLDRLNASRYKQREARKAENCCAGCGNQDEYTLSGRSYCKVCTDRRTTDERERYSIRLLHHECTSCGTRLPDAWYYTLCPACQEKSYERTRRYRARKREKREAEKKEG